MAEGEKWSGQPLGTTVASGDTLSMVQGGDNIQLPYDVLVTFMTASIIKTFSTGWVQFGGSVSNLSLTVTHNLNTALPGLIRHFFTSATGADTDAKELQYILIRDGDTSIHGIEYQAIGVNSFTVKTASQGLLTINPSTGAAASVGTTDYYKVVVYKL